VYVCVCVCWGTVMRGEVEVGLRGEREVGFVGGGNVGRGWGSGILIPRLSANCPSVQCQRQIRLQSHTASCEYSGDCKYCGALRVSLARSHVQHMGLWVRACVCARAFRKCPDPAKRHRIRRMVGTSHGEGLASFVHGLMLTKGFQSGDDGPSATHTRF